MRQFGQTREMRRVDERKRQDRDKEIKTSTASGEADRTVAGARPVRSLPVRVDLLREDLSLAMTSLEM